ncbi:MAG: MGMT family protein [Salegentibacter sp.]|uniref:Methylated-DNA-protein-cysteine methyltransferase related protein n=1 Tax=Salegentibacter flavus TaxID=287099 RepID=A0A1I5AQM9_9FLAO|nr:MULTISPECIES: MGMT family protein [Salegentibacter]MDR9456653.1 MGMT family protein [Salegentibacter sp.]SFN64745.1 methylated-DNA-protein-cysteine methyltransferase related protein [Salegentibacter flavus]
MISEEKNFFDKVYETVRQIPVGRVTSYGAIARAIGSPQSARMVGWAMNASHNLEDVPAHRVVNRNGLLSGKHHFGDSNAMRNLLEAEGVPVRENKVLDFDEYFWDPSAHLNP